MGQERGFVVLILNLIFNAVLVFAGDEGFFNKNQVKLPFNLDDVSGASYLVEDYQNAGKHTGNAFAVSNSGYIITNYHVAFSCVKENAPFFKAKYGSLKKLDREGFLTEDLAQGLPCASLKLSQPMSSAEMGGVERYSVSLISLPPIEPIPYASNAKEAYGPYYDFAILKINLPENKTLNQFFKLNSDEVSDLKQDDDVYYVGYPSTTLRAEDSQLIKDGVYQDVVSGDYRVSTGKNLKVEPDFYYQPQKFKYIYASTDGGQGTSGSALLNNKGMLIGLILGSGDDKTTVGAGGCYLKYKYCGGAALYLRANVIVETLEKSFPSLLKEINILK